MSVKSGLTPKRERETSEYAGMIRRMLRAYGRRVGEADEADLADMVAMRDELDAAIREAVRRQRQRGLSWSYIASGLGTTRQAAQMRYREGG